MEAEVTLAAHGPDRRRQPYHPRVREAVPQAASRRRRRGRGRHAGAGDGARESARSDRGRHQHAGNGRARLYARAAQRSEDRRDSDRLAHRRSLRADPAEGPRRGRQRLPREADQRRRTADGGEEVSRAMSLPQLLLVDDSEAVLAFEKAALSRHYDIRTATTGSEALSRLAEEAPAAVLLDLSMPEMDGDEVLARMQADAQLRRVPVIVISSETQRAAECLAAGAKAFLPKPIRAPELLTLVGRVIDDARREARAGNLAALFVSVGQIEVGLPLECVHTVLHQTATRPLPLGPAYLCEMLELHGEPVGVLDLARRFGQDHVMPVHERKLVVVDCDGARLALCVDDVRDPEELSAGEITPREKLAGTQHGPLQDSLIAVARTQRGPLPIVDPRALISRELLRKLAAGLRAEAAP